MEIELPLGEPLVVKIPAADSTVEVVFNGNFLDVRTEHPRNHIPGQRTAHDARYVIVEPPTQA